jgi:putative peptide zinc metalloprotease protein
MAVIAQTASNSSISLPGLREELKLVQGPDSIDGSPSWSIFDPIRNSYFSISWKAFQLISRWRLGNGNALLESVKNETTYKPEHEDLEVLINFLFKNDLTITSQENNYRDYLDKYELTNKRSLAWFFKNYLFFRVPILNPTRLLEHLLPIVEPLFSRTTRNLILIMGLIGVLLVTRQLDTFFHTFASFFSLEGMIFYFCSLFLIKILHEFGHALTAKRYGCQVPTMGVAFLVMYPVLYTDTTDAWKLTSHKQRIHIGAAGMISELGLACIATFFWSFLPDGIFRNIAFVIATTSWILTIAINVNPFMRFDGYYILSDILGIQNLQSRSFALAKWQLRQILFNTKEPVPEKFTSNYHRLIVAYAWGVWIYRFFLFLGIALLVYYFFFKALGIIMFVVEIYWFIILPVIKEFMEWWEMRQKIRSSKRAYITASVLVLTSLLFIAPWSTTVIIPAVLETEDKITIHAATPAIMEEILVTEDTFVNKGDILFKTHSPQLEQESRLTALEIDLLNLRIQRYAASAEELDTIHVVLQELKEQETRLEGIIREQEKLNIRSPINGVVTDLEPNLGANRWINPDMSLAYIIDPSLLKMEGYISEQDLRRITIGDEAEFIPEDIDRKKVTAHIDEIDNASSKEIDIPYLSSVYQGKIPSVKDSNAGLIPENAIYRVRFDVSGGNLIPPNQVIRGVIHIHAQRQSLASYLYTQTASVLIRESGF